MDIALKQYSAAATHVSEITKQFHSLGIIGLAYMRLYPNGSVVNLASCPNWTNFYYKQLFDERYTEQDIFDHLYFQEGISLWALNPSNQTWLDVAQKFGYGNGVTISEEHEKFSEIFAVYSRSDNTNINHFYINNIDFLKKIKLYFIEQSKSLIIRAEKDKDSFIHPKLLQQDEKHVLKNSFNKINYHSLALNKNIILHRKTNLPVYLSPRRNQCFIYLIEGRSTKEIARAMNLSPKTVEHYLKILRDELGCISSRELIVYYGKAG